MYAYRKKLYKINSIIVMVFLLLSLIAINGYAADNPQIKWIRIYNNNYTDKAYAVTTDTYNNVIVTGVSRINDMDRSYTIKYDTNGNYLFDITSDLPYPSETYDVEVDSQNNIILVGDYFNAQSNYDYYVAKYDSNGNKLWTQSYNSGSTDIAYSVAIDSNDNIVVTGEAAQNYYTIKYNEFGVEQWNKMFNTFDENYAKSVAIDGYDNIIVTGSVYTGDICKWYTIKYNSNGQELWNKTFSNGNNAYANAVTTSSDNSIIVMGTIYQQTNEDMYLIKYDEMGNELWNRYYDYSVGDTFADITTNSVNDIIVAGSTFETGQDKNYVLVKYDSNGIFLWSIFYDRYCNDDYGNGVAVDTQNDIYITGLSKNYAESYDYLTIKYDDTVSQDLENPEITNVNANPNPQQSGGNVNISCMATDNIGISTVKVYITDPNNLDFNITMSSNGNGIYYYNAPYTIVGTYNYYISAWDTSNNQETSSTYSFDITASQNNPPYQPYNPSPTSGAIDIDTNIGLTWTGGDPDPGDTVTYDVYFGTATPPLTIVSDNQSVTTYKPWTMNLDTKYYWQIVSWDNHGISTLGPIWDFTTVIVPNNPPNIANTPIGQTIGYINVLYEYNTSALDIDNDMLSYGWDWDGDLIIDEWSNWYNSGETCTMYHSWDELGTYDIRVKTKDIHLAENDSLSAALSVTIINNPPNEPSNPYPANGTTNTGLNVDLWWTGGDIDGDEVTYDVYFEADDSTPDILVSENQTDTHYDPGNLNANTSYYWQIIAEDTHADTSEGPVWEFITKESEENNPPNKPTNIQPVNGATDINTTPILSVYVSDPDGDSLSVNFYNAADNSLIDTTIVQNDSNAFVIWSGLSNSTIYNWYAVANDSLLENISETWSFTTKDVDTPSGGDNGGDQPPSGDGGGSGNVYPTAEANGPYYGFTNIEINFDATNSHDNDENGQSILQYDWKFFAEDSWHTNLGSKPGYVYTKEGEYTVSLQVHDDEGSTGIDTTIAYITNNTLIADANGPYFGVPGELIEFDGSGSLSFNGDTLYYRWDWTSDLTYDTEWLTSPFTTHSYENAGMYIVTLQIKTDDNITAINKTSATIQALNNPPTNPVVDGTTIGLSNTDYSYTAVSTDLDNNKIRYIFEWDDGTNDTITGFASSNTIVNVTHSWAGSGVYNLQVFAEDENNALSGSTKLLIFIDLDVKFIEGNGVSGYLVDSDSDGIYDAFYNKETGNESDVEKLDNGSYLLDLNNDGIWDALYDTDTDTIIDYELPKENEETTKASGFWYMFGLGMFLLIIVSLILWLILTKKNKNEDKKDKKPLKK
jgi:hypothetical protein